MTAPSTSANTATTAPATDTGLLIYNTLSRRKEPFSTIEPGKVRMYVCGVTVYDEAHIGHAFTFIVFDVIRRYLEHIGYEVDHVQNYTDIDDKLIARAERDGSTVHEVADRYIAEFERDVIIERTSSGMRAVARDIGERRRAWARAAGLAATTSR